MSSADIVILIVIGLLSYYGWHRGIIRSAFNFAGLTLGALVAALYLHRLLPDTFAGGSGSFAMIIGILEQDTNQVFRYQVLVIDDMMHHENQGFDLLTCPLVLPLGA